MRLLLTSVATVALAFAPGLASASVPALSQAPSGYAPFNTLGNGATSPAADAVRWGKAYNLETDFGGNCDAHITYGDSVTTVAGNAAIVTMFSDATKQQVGDYVVIAGAGASANPLATTIATITDAHHFTVAAAPSTSETSVTARVVFAHTDNAAAFGRAFTAMANGGTLDIGAVHCGVASQIASPNLIGNFDAGTNSVTIRGHGRETSSIDAVASISGAIFLDANDYHHGLNFHDVTVNAEGVATYAYSLPQGVNSMFAAEFANGLQASFSAGSGGYAASQSYWTKADADPNVFPAAAGAVYPPYDFYDLGLDSLHVGLVAYGASVSAIYSAGGTHHETFVEAHAWLAPIDFWLGSDNICDNCTIDNPLITTGTATASWTTGSTTISVAAVPAFMTALGSNVTGVSVYDTTTSEPVGIVSSFSGTTITLTAHALNASSGSTDALQFSSIGVEMTGNTNAWNGGRGYWTSGNPGYSAWAFNIGAGSYWNQILNPIIEGLNTAQLLQVNNGNCTGQNIIEITGVAPDGCNYGLPNKLMGTTTDGTTVVTLATTNTPSATTLLAIEPYFSGAVTGTLAARDFTNNKVAAWTVSLLLNCGAAGTGGCTLVASTFTAFTGNTLTVGTAPSAAGSATGSPLSFSINVVGNASATIRWSFTPIVAGL